MENPETDATLSQSSVAKLNKYQQKTKSLLENKDMTLNKNKLFEKKMKYQGPDKVKSSHKSEKMKKRLKLIEDYFYPEATSPCIDPNEHTPIIHRDSFSAMLKTQRYRPRPTLKNLEGSMALKEVKDSPNSSKFLNCSIIQTIK